MIKKLSEKSKKTRNYRKKWKVSGEKWKTELKTNRKTKEKTLYTIHWLFYIYVNLFVSYWMIAFLESFIKKCNDCKYLFVYEKTVGSFSIYSCIKCEKKYYKFKLDEKL